MSWRRSLLVAATDRGVFALLQHAQKSRLRLHRHVADLVEKERAAFCLLEAAGAARVGAGEGALLMTKQFRLDEVARNSRHVDGDERSGAPLAIVVQRARHQLFAGAGFAADHHREIRLHQSRQHPVDFLHRRRAPDQRDRLEILALDRLPRPFLRLRQRAANDGDQFLEVERLRQVFVRAALGGADRGHERVLRAHDHDRQVRARLLDPRQEVEGAFIRQHHVGDDEFAVALADPAPERSGVAGRAHFVSGARQRLVEHGADRRIVIGNENVSRRHRYSPRGSLLPFPATPSLTYIGISTRNVVRRGCDSHSMMPP